MGKRKPRFLCDADGIVADFTKAAIQVMNKLSGKEHTVDHILQWEVTEVLEDAAHREAARHAFEQLGFCETFEVYDGSQEAVNTLKAMTDFYFVTSPMTRNPGWFNERFHWLSKHFGVDPRHVNFVTDKFIVSGDYLLDDSEKNLEAWLSHNPNGTALIWDRPWNRREMDSRIVRVSSWDEVIAVLLDLSDRIPGRTKVIEFFQIRATFDANNAGWGQGMAFILRLFTKTFASQISWGAPIRTTRLFRDATISAPSSRDGLGFLTPELA